MNKISKSILVVIIALTDCLFIASCLPTNSYTNFPKYSSQGEGKSVKTNSKKDTIKNGIVRRESNSFIVYQPENDFRLPEIVLQYDNVYRSGANWTDIKNPKWYEANSSVLIGRAANYISEGLTKMTGQNFRIVSRNNLSKGIILTLLNSASDDIKKDREVQAALRSDPSDQYAANEAFYIRSEKDRILIVANTPDGLLSAATALMESVDYEVLGMGPNWIYAPNYRNKSLIFNVNTSQRPSYYFRGLTATTGGQNYGRGTIMGELSDPQDEPVNVSYWRWLIGARIYGKSMAIAPGHALQKYHQEVLNHIKTKKTTEGFLAKMQIGLNRDRPPAYTVATDTLWINTDLDRINTNKVFRSSDREWLLEKNPKYVSSFLDLSVSFVRQIILDDLKKMSELNFKNNPNSVFSFGIEPEDGSKGNHLTFSRHKNWYVEYLASNRIPFGQPYSLHNYNGINQPFETWDENSESDQIFAFANWILREYDKWIDSLPPERSKTSTGVSKKKLIRCGFYSYNFHDVPPNFNIDNRMSITIASYPKNRGKGKWDRLKTQEDIALALRKMLGNNEPLVDKRIISLAKSLDVSYQGIEPRRNRSSRRVFDRYRLNTSSSVENIVNNYQHSYGLGYRGISFETDFNFGKQGLEYYLTSKILWNVNLSSQNLENIRDRWFQRSFGSGWQEMKAYYDFMLLENYPRCNGPQAWSKAISLIDAADSKISVSGEVDAQKRIDDVKQYWYNLYLFDTGKQNPSSPEFREYLWKGQMSYMVAMNVLIEKHFKVRDPRMAVGVNISSGPAHFTHAETQVWWEKLKKHWQSAPKQCHR